MDSPQRRFFCVTTYNSGDAPTIERFAVSRSVGQHLTTEEAVTERARSKIADPSLLKVESVSVFAEHTIFSRAKPVIEVTKYEFTD